MTDEITDKDLPSEIPDEEFDLFIKEWTLAGAHIQQDKDHLVISVQGSKAWLSRVYGHHGSTWYPVDVEGLQEAMIKYDEKFTTQAPSSWAGATTVSLLTGGTGGIIGRTGFVLRRLK